jgi:hypothetical protein
MVGRSAEIRAFLENTVWFCYTQAVVNRVCAFSLSISLCFVAVWPAAAQSQYESTTDYAKYAIKLRESGLLKIQGSQRRPSAVTASPLDTRPRPETMNSSARLELVNGEQDRYPWRLNIMTTIFWIGEHPTTNNPVPNDRSSWDPNWSFNYGGYDDPELKLRKNFIPVSFMPRQNPFYVALPYNDVEGDHTKPEAKQVIPWFKDAFLHDGQSVLKGRWVAIRHGNHICYAQWEDCGPFRTDHWQYVFGNERPKPNLNQNAGLDVSPAVRDYLGLSNLDTCDWKFVEFRDVPPGPWAMYGDNNRFVILRRQSNERFARRNVLLNGF